MIDLALDTNEDLLLTSGDFTARESTAQHQQQLLLNGKGEFKESPTTGVGVLTYSDDEHLENVARAVSIAFTQDGMDVEGVRISKGGILESTADY
jgi:hypothetical protein